MTPDTVHTVANEASRVLSTINIGAGQRACMGDAIEILRGAAIAGCPPAVPAVPAAASGQAPLSVLATLTRQRDGWREEAESLRRRLRSAESDIDARAKHQRNDVWYYQGDGYDHIESMATDMVVVIHAADLRALVAAGPATGAAT